MNKYLFPKPRSDRLAVNKCSPLRREIPTSILLNGTVRGFFVGGLQSGKMRLR